MEKSNGKPASERTPLIQRRDFIDGPRKQQPQTQAMATDATGAMEPPPSAQPEVQNCPDPLSSIQTEAKQIVDLVILAMAKVQQAPPRPSTENLEGNEECEEVTVHTVVPTSAVPASRATRDAHGKFGVYSPLYLGRSEIETNNVNTLVDAVLAQLLERPEISELINPLKIEERIPIDDKGNYVSQIVVKGLTSFGRTSDAILAVLDDGSITVEAGMGIKKVDTTLEYQYTVGKCCFAFSGMVGAQLDGATAKIKIKIKGFTPSLISLDVDFGDPKVVKFSGASFAFNWLAKLIVNKVIVSRKEEIRQQIISKASHGLEEILSNLNLLSILRDKSVAF